MADSELGLLLCGLVSGSNPGIDKEDFLACSCVDGCPAPDLAGCLASSLLLSSELLKQIKCYL